ncbi:MAG: hypothetical protein LC776_15125, partial [Acidobacteria bacterium]|nr:hypothetical protein [Acidobacteriota bacterium]
ETETEVRIELSGDILFDFDKATLRPAAEPILTRVAEVIRKYGKPTQAPRIAPAAHGPPHWEADFDPHEGTDLSEPLPEYEFDQQVSW